MDWTEEGVATIRYEWTDPRQLAAAQVESFAHELSQTSDTSTSLSVQDRFPVAIAAGFVAFAISRYFCDEFSIAPAGWAVGAFGISLLFPFASLIRAASGKAKPSARRVRVAVELTVSPAGLRVRVGDGEPRVLPLDALAGFDGENALRARLRAQDSVELPGLPTRDANVRLAARLDELLLEARRPPDDPARIYR